MGKRPLDAVVVLLPGILGSRLAMDGEEIWGPSAGAVLRGLWSRGDSINRLILHSDPLDPAVPADGVLATDVVPDVHLIPGLWKITGYTTIEETIRANFALAEDQFYRFPYDWRRDIRAPARLLAEEAPGWIDAYRRRSGSSSAKLLLIAHSQGGLVARYYLECLEGWRDTSLLVTFGTPHLGSLNPLDFVSNGFTKSLGPVAERAALEDQLTADQPAPAMTWTEWVEALPGETRAWLDAVIERVTIAPAAKRGRMFDPSRVTIAWASRSS